MFLLFEGLGFGTHAGYSGLHRLNGVVSICPQGLFQGLVEFSDRANTFRRCVEFSDVSVQVLSGFRILGLELSVLFRTESMDFAGFQELCRYLLFTLCVFSCGLFWWIGILKHQYTRAMILVTNWPDASIRLLGSNGFK